MLTDSGGRLATHNLGKRLSDSLPGQNEQAAVCPWQNEAPQHEPIERGDVSVTHWTLEGRLSFLNESAARKLGGSSPDEYVGKSISQLVGAPAARRHLERIREAVDSPDP